MREEGKRGTGRNLGKANKNSHVTDDGKQNGATGSKTMPREAKRSHGKQNGSTGSKTELQEATRGNGKQNEATRSKTRPRET